MPVALLLMDNNCHRAELNDLVHLYKLDNNATFTDSYVRTVL